MRKFFISALVMFLAYQGAYHQTHKDEKPFVTYSNGMPAVWKANTPVCLKLVNRPKSLTRLRLLEVENYFTQLTGIEINKGCSSSNVQIKFGPRTQLSYLANNSAVGAAVALLDSKAKDKIVGGKIQIEELAFSVSSDTTRFNLILHELGHVIGFAHSRDGGLMTPVLTDIKKENYPVEAITELASISRHSN
jgi:hypothetical protein